MMEYELNKHCFDIMHRLYEMSEKNEHCDAVLCLGENLNIYCHKNVLVAKSKVFEEVINELPFSLEKTIIDIKNVSFAAMKRFLRYIYIGDIPTETEEIYQDFLKIMHTFYEKDFDPKSNESNQPQGDIEIKEDIFEKTTQPVISVEILGEDINPKKSSLSNEVDFNQSDISSDYIPSTDDDTNSDGNMHQEIIRIPKARRTSRIIKSTNNRSTKSTANFFTKAEFDKHKKACEEGMTHRVHWGNSAPFKCPYKGCNTVRNTKGKIRYHYRAAHMKIYQCPFCPLTLNCPSDLKFHVRRHTGEKPFKCNDCGKGYINTFELKTHILSHTRGGGWNERPLKVNCPTCGQGFASQHMLYNHIVNIHKDVKLRAKLHCDRCSKAFTIPANLRKHKKKCTTLLT